MAKRTEIPQGWPNPRQVFDVYSVGSCVNEDFADYVDYWKHNSWWFFNSPEPIVNIARENSVDVRDLKLFYYEAYEQELFDGVWRSVSLDTKWGFVTEVLPPASKRLEGFDVVILWVENSPEPEHSPLSCQNLAGKFKTNSHCLFDRFDEAYTALDTGKFDGCEQGTRRIFAVYSVDWPKAE